MLDDLRQHANEIAYDDEPEISVYDKMHLTQGQFLGLSPFQRFLLASMLLIIACLLSALVLLVTEKINPQVFL